MTDLHTLNPDQADAAPVRSWLVDVLAASRVDGCADCGPASICPGHAADAVLDATRREELFVMPKAFADQMIERAREQGRAEVLGR
ncbi:hypothetical protein [Catenuloplanes atrovinosus]|uniref:Uncharacterized protein n=1 Tax=Catenuloplanes atrovinosus TaxID=137266 RepID=A0AAE3YS70_9ACTN|nr:hypothetical protein [Catenuloplanes atrovinosus]MDR7278914.1 hypothetical protein [Catenuloplanes atrovinosus]